MAAVACAGVNRPMRRADQQEDEGDQAADDVQAVEAGGQVEDRAVAVDDEIVVPSR